MNYAKPEVFLLGNASIAIQTSDGDKRGGPFESALHPTESPAYEADE
jgi:hypothetical protein